jgi:hypothetical protein
VKQLTFERATQLLRYDAETGEIFNRIDRKPAKAGQPVGQSIGGSRRELRYITVDRNTYSFHRIAWLLHYGEWAARISHIDGNTLNNKISNLTCEIERADHDSAKRTSRTQAVAQLDE